MKADGLRVFSAAYDRAMRRPSSDDEEPGTAVAGLRATMLTQLGRLLDALAGRGLYVNHLEAPAVVSMEADSTDVASPS